VLGPRFTIVGVTPFESWIDRQIREAQERGEFDNLSGAGKPIKGLNGRDDENWWVKNLMERENLKPMLPGSLALRKEVEDLPTTVADIRIEEHVREVAEDLNHRIRDSRRRKVDGPALFINTVDVDAVVEQWRHQREDRAD
jgi:hypothetical protein